MFLLDSLMISGISWALRTAVTAAEAEMNDDTALREQLLAAEMQREMGEISDEAFAGIERDLLARIREIKERREGGSGPLAFGDGEPIERTEDSRFQIEASVSGDFHDPEAAPHTTVIEDGPADGGLVRTRAGRTVSVLDVEPGDAAPLQDSALPLPTAKGARRRRRQPRPSTPRRTRLADPRRIATSGRSAPKARKIR